MKKIKIATKIFLDKKILAVLTNNHSNMIYGGGTKDECPPPKTANMCPPTTN